MKELGKFVKHLKPSKTFYYLYSVEAMFLFLMISTFKIWAYLQQKIFDNFSAPYGNVMQDNAFIIEMMANDFRQYLVYFILLNVVILLLFMVYWSVSRTLIWTTLFKQKNKPFFKFSLLKLIWQIVWAPLLLMLLIPLFMYSDPQTESMALIYSSVAMLNLVVYGIMAYFGMHLYYSFFKNKSIYKALFDSFRNGILKLRKLAFPYLLLGIFFYVTVKLINVLNLPVYINLLILLYPLTVSRTYLFKKLK